LGEDKLFILTNSEINNSFDSIPRRLDELKVVLVNDLD
jgi:hypothetical protein